MSVKCAPMHVHTPDCACICDFCMRGRQKLIDAEAHRLLVEFPHLAAMLGYLASRIDALEASKDKPLPIESALKDAYATELDRVRAERDKAHHELHNMTRWRDKACAERDAALAALKAARATLEAALKPHEK